MSTHTRVAPTTNDQRPTTTSPLLMAAAGLAALLVSACVQTTADAPPDGTAVQQPRGTDQLKPQYDTAGKLQKLEYDRNKDGKVDAWGYMDGARVVRVEVDDNGDGKIDRWEYHRADAAAGTATPAGAAPGVDKTVERIERATKFDGKVSRKEFFDNGVLTRIEEDTDGDGRIDKWETYTNGSLSILALDTQGNGRPDRRLVYSPDGSFDHIETDPTGSGTFITQK